MRPRLLLWDLVDAPDLAMPFGQSDRVALCPVSDHYVHKIEGPQRVAIGQSLPDQRKASLTARDFLQLFGRTKRHRPTSDRPFKISRVGRSKDFRQGLMSLPLVVGHDAGRQTPP